MGKKLKSIGSSVLPFLFCLVAGCGQQDSMSEENELVNYYDSAFMVNGEAMKVPRFPEEYKYIQVNDIPPRFQWNGNNGYCGETAIITAGLYYGQYISQYDVRSLSYIADSGNTNVNQGDQIGFYKPESESNAYEVAQTLRLNVDAIATRSDTTFICWIKRNVALGHPVMIGVLNNVRLLIESNSVDGGDDEYDHIVPVIGFASKKPLINSHGDVLYDAEDIILFSDNGIYTPGKGCGSIQCVPTPARCVPYYYPIRIDTIFKTRKQANTEAVYSLKKDLCDNCFLYGIGFTGIKQDEGNKFLPVRLYTNLNYESACNTYWPDSDSLKADTCCIYQPPSFGQPTINQRPDSASLQMKAVVSELEKGKEYELLQFNNEKDIPGHPVKRIPFKAEGERYILDTTIWSNQKLFYRVVEKKK